jgi:hypothetical protein
MILVEVWDATGNKRQSVEMPDDAPIDRLVAVLVDKMRFPQNGPDGQLLSYKLQHKSSGKQLLESQTLASAGVKPSDVLRLMPEITAGAPAHRIQPPRQHQPPPACPVERGTKTRSIHTNPETPMRLLLILTTIATTALLLGCESRVREARHHNSTDTRSTESTSAAANSGPRI